jgi:myo-inositol-1(or 4)-monophosphatase
VTLIPLAASVMEIFSTIGSNSGAEVEFLKNGNLRDVVTQADLKLHKTVQDFCFHQRPESLFISEEGAISDDVWNSLVNAPSVFLADPLDGSNNLACGLAEYGFMACGLSHGRIVESIVVLPNENQVIDWSLETNLFSSRPISRQGKLSASAYLAYAPKLDQAAASTRIEMMNLLDSRTSGIYRYGSACVGLYRCLIGVHSSFVGLRMRPWDVVPFFPLLSLWGAHLAYSASKQDVTLIVSFDEDLFHEGRTMLQKRLGSIVTYKPGDALEASR